MTNYEKVLIEIGQVCIDVYNDIGECHLCEVTITGRHDPNYDNEQGCPVELAIIIKEEENESTNSNDI